MEVIFVLLVLILDFWGISGVLQGTASSGGKAAWIAGIVILPLLGFLAWFLSDPADRSSFV